MSEDRNAENPDATEISIEAEESLSPLDQLNEFNETGPDGWVSAMVALPCFGASLLGTLFVMYSVLGPGNQQIPIVLLVLIFLVPVVVGLATVAQLRRWFFKKLNTPLGSSVSSVIRFLGWILTLLCSLLVLVLAFKSTEPRADQLLAFGFWLALGALMGLFPRGQVK